MNYTHRHQVLLYIFVGCIFITYSCNLGPFGGQQDKKTSDEFIAAQNKIGTHVDKIIHDLPSPSEIPLAINAFGIPLSNEAINPIERFEDYLVSNSKAALSLGIYASDIGYLVSYKQVDKAQKYINGCQKIAERLGIATAINSELYKRFQNSSNNKDSLVAIADEIMHNVEKRLEDLNEIRIASLSLAGMFIESIYITAQLAERVAQSDLTASEKEANLRFLLELITKQEILLLDLKSVLKETERDASIMEIIDNIELLSFSIDDLSDYLETQKQNNKSINFDDPIVQKLINDINNIRDNIVRH